MSYRIPNLPDKAETDPSDSGSSAGDDTDDNVSDWASTFGDALRTKSLFDDLVFPTPEEAIAYDSDRYGFDLREVRVGLGLDVYGVMRVVNLVRGEKLSAQDALGIKGDDPRLKDDGLLKPVMADDPLLQLDFDDSWSDDEDLKATPASTQPTRQGQSQPNAAGPLADADAGADADPRDARIKALEAELSRAKNSLSSMRTLLHDTMNDNEGEGGMGGDGGEVVAGPSGASSRGKGKGKIPAGTDDDTHYFDSYAENDIHEIMLKDTTRTISYAKFILSNPRVFKGATVMDVGCGTGILSMFAARAGAKQVFAIEASGLASKARENIKKNGLDGVITVIQGKVEDIELPVKQVDVIISEWMGYMLLYESMLDSVLDARDRFLAPDGLMAPSQTRLVISGITGDRVWKERVDFWNGVYGFDMTTMDSVYFNEGMVEYVDEKEIVTDEVVVRDINSHNATPKSLDFTSSFTLTASENTTIRAFLTHFDTFFSPHAGMASQVPLDHAVDIVKYGVDEYDRPVVPAIPIAGDEESEKGTEISFTTGPKGVETHWRQVVFLLREPIKISAGNKIVGRFLCRKSATNSRELDVEIHYGLEGSADKVAAVFKVC